MKNWLLVFLLFCFYSSFAQGDLRGNRIIADQSFYLRNRWIDTIGNDTNFYNKQRTLPTAKGVYDFVHGRFVPIWNALNGKQATLVSGTNIKTINGNSLLGSGDISISGTGSAISLKYQAWVDSSGNDGTAAVGDPSKPYRTINAALVALPNTSAAKIVHIGIGTFAGFDSDKLYPNTWLKGSKQPDFDIDINVTYYDSISKTTPTKLINGTIIQAAIDSVFVDGIKITDLGVDLGSAAIAGGLSPANNIGIGTLDGTMPIRQLSNMHLENLTLLGSTASVAYHSIVMENCYNATVRNIKEMGNVHGYAFKNNAGVFENLWGAWNTNDVFILKFDDYAPANEMILDNWYATSLSEVSRETGAGLIINQTSAGAEQGRLKITNGTIKSTSYGIKTDGTGAELVEITLSNITINNCTNDGINVTKLARSVINNISAVSNGGDGIKVTSAPNGEVRITNSYAAGNGGDGIDVTGAASLGKTYIFGNVSNFNTGYGIRANGSLVYGNDNTTRSNTAGAVTGTIYSTGTFAIAQNHIPYGDANNNNTSSSTFRFDGTSLRLGGSSEMLLNPSARVFTMGGSTPLTPWTAHQGVIEGGGGSVFFGQATDVFFTSNGVYNTVTPSGWKYVTTAPASNLLLYNGEITMRVAGSGSAGSAITWINALKASATGALTIVNPTTSNDTSSNKILVVDGSGNIKKSNWLYAGSSASGTFTPTVTYTTNTSTGTPQEIIYTRIGNVVSFSGTILINADAAGSAEFQLTLPISSNFTTTTDLKGTVTDADVHLNYFMQADASTDRLKITFTAAAAGARPISFAGHYIVK